MTQRIIDAVKQAAADGNLNGGTLSDPEALQAFLDDMALKTNQIGADNGDLATATTTAKTTVGAINELNSQKWMNNTLSTRSAFRAGKSTGTQAISTATNVKVTFDTEAYDQLNEYNSGTSTFTASADGLYLVNVGIYVTGITGTPIFLSEVWVNNTYYLALSRTMAAPGGDYVAGGSVVIKLTAGQTVTINFVCTGSAVTISPGTQITYFEITRIA